MIVILVVGGLGGWQARRASIQRRAVAQLREAGASVQYDWQAMTPTGPARVEPPGPGWLRRIVGDELFQEVQQVILSGATLRPGEPTEESMAALANLDRLEHLQLSKSLITDARFARLWGHPRLRTASLVGTKLTHESLATARTWPRLEALTIRFDQPRAAGEVLSHLAGMTQLRRLNLSPLRPIESADLAVLATLPDLEYVSLYPSPSDDACLTSLAGLNHLTGIHLRNTRATDAGMRRLAHLADLERVALDGSTLSDDGLIVAAGWPKLRELFLIAPGSDEPGWVPTGQLTDRSLAALAGHPSLDNLTLAGRFTDAGLATLNRAPKLDTLILYGLEGEATAAGLRALLAGRQFRQLGLHGPGVRADWAAELGKQTGLEYLSLAGPNVDDAMLGRLAGIASLGRLFITDAPITDAGLIALARGNNALRILYLRGTKVTPAGVAAFQSPFRTCDVDYQPAPAVLNPVVGPRR